MCLRAHRTLTQEVHLLSVLNGCNYNIQALVDEYFIVARAKEFDKWSNDRMFQIGVAD